MCEIAVKYLAVESG